MTAQNEWQIAIPYDAGMQIRWAAKLLAEAVDGEVAGVLASFPVQAQLVKGQPIAIVDDGLLEVGAEGYAITREADNLLIRANSDYGLASGLLAAARQARVAGPESIQSGVVEPHFISRDMYHFPTPWQLHGITTDTFTLSDWRRHIEWVRSLGANRLIVDLWSTQYYHPEFEETWRNEPYWEILRGALGYAQDLGLHTALLLFPCLVPPSVYYRYPELQAPEEGNYYWGSHLCWTRGKEVLSKLLSFTFEYFEHAIDGAVLEYWDPGMCLCAECWQDFARTGLDIYQTLAELASAHTRTGMLDVVTLHVDGIATGQWEGADGQPLPYDDPEAIERLIAGFAPGTTVIDLHPKSLAIARSRGLPTSQFFFELDPESGLDSFQLFPRPCLKLISRRVTKSMQEGHTGMVDYRLAPNLHFPGDYVLMRKLWEPQVTAREALTELAAQLCSSGQQCDDFVRSVELTDEWWEGKQLETLQEASALAEVVAQAEDAKGRDRLRVWADGLRVLSVVADYASRGAAADEALFTEMVDAVHRQMQTSWIYQSLTADESWVERSKEMIGLRLKWWLRAVEEATS